MRTSPCYLAYAQLNNGRGRCQGKQAFRIRPRRIRIILLWIRGIHGMDLVRWTDYIGEGGRFASQPQTGDSQARFILTGLMKLSIARTPTCVRCDCSTLLSFFQLLERAKLVLYLTKKTPPRRIVLYCSPA